MCQWSSARTSSLTIIPALSPVGLFDAVLRLRRGLRDDHRALIMVAHQGVDRREVLEVLGRRWPDVVVKGLEQEEPAWTMSVHDAAGLGSRRRGVEPLRIVVLSQKIMRVTVAQVPVIEPMTIVV